MKGVMLIVALIFSAYAAPAAAQHRTASHASQRPIVQTDDSARYDANGIRPECRVVCAGVFDIRNPKLSERGHGHACFHCNEWDKDVHDQTGSDCCSGADNPDSDCRATVTRMTKTPDGSLQQEILMDHQWTTMERARKAVIGVPAPFAYGCATKSKTTDNITGKQWPPAPICAALSGVF